MPNEHMTASSQPRYTIRLITLVSHDPYANFSFENLVYDTIKENEITLLLWRNSNSVVMGKGQNSWAEANLDYLNKQNIPLLRRMSGGGAVFNDMGNINFSLIAPKPFYSGTILTQLIKDLLISLGIPATLTPRNDIIVTIDNENYKFSGSAYRENSRKGLHHGTLLVNANLGILRNTLRPAPADMESKGIQSVRSHVINLADIKNDLTVEVMHALLIQTLRESFAANGHVITEYIDAHHAINEETDLTEKFTSWDWVFGKTPRFRQLIYPHINRAELHGFIDINQGRIIDISLKGEGVHESDITYLNTALKQCKYDQSAIKECLPPPKVEYTHHNISENISRQSIVEWLIHHLPIGMS